MCSASHPSSRAMTDAKRSAKHFLPSRALPPYPEPQDQISLVSGKCEMYLVVLHGYGTSAWPARSGAPTECTARTNEPRSEMSRSAGVPILVMIRIDTAT